MPPCGGVEEAWRAPNAQSIADRDATNISRRFAPSTLPSPHLQSPPRSEEASIFHPVSPAAHRPITSDLSAKEDASQGQLRHRQPSCSERASARRFRRAKNVTAIPPARCQHAKFGTGFLVVKP